MKTLIFLKVSSFFPFGLSGLVLVLLRDLNSQKSGFEDSRL